MEDNRIIKLLEKVIAFGPVHWGYARFDDFTPDEVEYVRQLGYISVFIPPQHNRNMIIRVELTTAGMQFLSGSSTTTTNYPCWYWCWYWWNRFIKFLNL